MIIFVIHEQPEKSKEAQDFKSLSDGSSIDSVVSWKANAMDSVGSTVQNGNFSFTITDLKYANNYELKPNERQITQ